MNNNPDLIREMADVYIKTVRELETQVRELKAENASLRLIVQELREASDTYYEGETHNYE